MKIFKLMKGKQRGFTLVELLVAIPIVAVVVAAATGGLVQVMNSRDASTHMFALRQVQTAGYWVSTDGLQADSVIPGAGTTVVTLTWVDWTNLEGPESHTVIYSLSGAATSMQLMRYETVLDSDGGLLRDTTTFVARHLTQATCQWGLDPGKLEFTVTAVVSGQEASRTYDIRPRSLTL